ncbi:MAG: SDR family NAD(P)-dependent oxidoreductase [Caulobacteraceae bacterium]|nr:SDR family NAD(P)-dependent oxidoreductase [Caulobacteraceae bacterium]
MSQHPAFVPGRVAVITGGASGIGLATARRLVDLGLVAVLADLPGESLSAAAASLGANAHAVPTDVSDPEALHRLKAAAYALGEVSLLMNNAGVGGARGKLWEQPERFRQVLETNLFGAVNGIQAFVPEMLARGLPGAIVNTGSKQGITTPPGDAAYNASKSALKVLTEQLEHQLRNTEGARISAHLLVPGSTYTGMVARHVPEKPAFSWTPEQVADRLLQGLGAGEFYIWCEDNETTREMDEFRIQWAADDLIKNRPALSRWHPDHAEAFKRYMEGARKP